MVLWVQEHGTSEAGRQGEKSNQNGCRLMVLHITGDRLYFLRMGDWAAVRRLVTIWTHSRERVLGGPQGRYGYIRSDGSPYTEAKCKGNTKLVPYQPMKFVPGYFSWISITLRKTVHPQHKITIHSAEIIPSPPVARKP